MAGERSDTDSATVKYDAVADPPGRSFWLGHTDACLTMYSYLPDTPATVRDLEAAGIARGHAEAIVSAISRTDGQVATKADLAAVKRIVGVQSAFILAMTVR